MKNKRNFIISASLIGFAIIFTLLVKFVDVKAVGVNGSNIGFSSINNFFHKLPLSILIQYFSNISAVLLNRDYNEHSAPIIFAQFNPRKIFSH